MAVVQSDFSKENTVPNKFHSKLAQKERFQFHLVPPELKHWICWTELKHVILNWSDIKLQLIQEWNISWEFSSCISHLCPVCKIELCTVSPSTKSHGHPKAERIPVPHRRWCLARTHRLYDLRKQNSRLYCTSARCNSFWEKHNTRCFYILNSKPSCIFH